MQFGQALPTLRPDKPSGFVSSSESSDVILVSLDFRVRYEYADTAEVTWGFCTLDTRELADTPPRDYMGQVSLSRTFGGHHSGLVHAPDEILGGIHRAINDALEPSCIDSCYTKVHKFKGTSHDQDTDEDFLICNPKRNVCNNPVHGTSENNWDHTGRW
jgi:hypothetical protein